MSRLAIHARSHFGAIVLSTLLMTAGGFYYVTQIASGVYPEVTFPRISVIAKVPGLAVPNMDVQVTQPLEQAISTVIGAARVRSKTIRGATEISIDFNPGANMVHAEQMTWNRISSIRSQLPAEAELTVEQMTPSIFPILSLTLTGGENPTQLRDYAYFQLAPKIKSIPDVLYANVAGGDIREIEVEVRLADLLAAGLSAADLADQIGKVHRLLPVGRIEQPPFAYQLIVNTQVETAADVENLVVGTRGNQPIRVRDVADVRIKHRDRLLSIGSDGMNAVVITVFRSLGGNTVNISAAVRDLIKQEPIPKNIHAAVAYDQAVFIENAVFNARDAILVGGFFSILILFAFLRSGRATLIAAVAIPTTLGITFLILSWIGETLNLMSLGGLAVAIGLIIDDAVVVIENIARHLSPKRSIQPETMQNDDDPIASASREITGAVIGSTLTTVIVFLPLAFLAGVYGQFFASLSRSLSIAILVSMVMSLTIIPVFAAKFLAGRTLRSPGQLYRLAAWLYEGVLGLSLRFPRMVLLASIASIALGAMLYLGFPNPRHFSDDKQPALLAKGIKTGLMPSMDEGAFVLDYWAPSGTPLQSTVEMVHRVEEILKKHPDVDAFVRRAGAELGLFATQTNRGDIQVMIRDAEEDPVNYFSKPVRPPLEELHDMNRAEIRKKYRRRPIAKIMEELEDEIKDEFSEHQLKIELIQIMQDELADLSGADKPIEIKIFGSDHTVLRSLATKVAELLEQKSKGHGLQEINSNVMEGNPDLMIRVDGAAAAKVGLNAEMVERQVKAIYLGQVATQLRESAERITDVRVRYPDHLRFGLGRFRRENLLEQLILIPEDSKAGNAAVGGADSLRDILHAVPLSAIAKIEPVRTPDEQYREDQQPAVFVTAAIEEEEIGLGEAVGNIREWMKEIKMPPGYRWEIGGHYLQQQQAFKSLFSVMIVAFVLVFLLLAFQFQSLMLPILIFLTQPLSLVSGMFALWLTATPLNISSYMGAILLVGLDMKNGILLVEYIQQLRSKGYELKSAITEAGQTRFRPILMTSLAAILGLLPLAFGIGPGAQMQRPLAIMVIGGLTANMLFTRLVIPAGYLLFGGAISREQTNAA